MGTSAGSTQPSQPRRGEAPIESRHDRDRRYNLSQKGRARHDRYNRSRKGQERRWRYEASDKGRQRRSRYESDNLVGRYLTRLARSRMAQYGVVLGPTTMAEYRTRSGGA